MARSRIAQVGSLFASIAIAQVSGSLVSLTAERSVKTWYPTLRKPAFNPPAGVFAPVWSILYLMMGVAKFLVDEKAKAGVLAPDQIRSANRLYYSQLVVNLAWIPLFFGLRRPLVALLDLLVLIPMIVRTLVTFRRIMPVAGLLMIPYLLWTCFATVLNAAIWWLNRPTNE